MTVIFSDGFDHYTTLTLKWTSGTSAIGAASARSGSSGLAQSSAESLKQVQPSQEHATFTLGLVARRTAATGTLEMRFYSDSGVTRHITVQATANGEIKAFRGAVSTGTQLGATTASNLVPLSVFVYVEAKVVLSDTVGTVTVWVNDAQVFSYTGDTKNAGTKTVLDAIGLASNGTFLICDIDDLYLTNGAGSVNNDRLGDIKIETLFPSGAGSTTGLTPSSSVANYTTVDDVAPNTTDYNSSVTDGAYDTYALSDLVTVAGTIFGVVVHAYAAKSDAGVKGGAIVVRSGGADYEKTDNPLGTGYQYYREIIEVDPATSSAWTVAAVNSLEAGFKVKAG